MNPKDLAAVFNADNYHIVEQNEGESSESAMKAWNMHDRTRRTAGLLSHNKKGAIQEPYLQWAEIALIIVNTKAYAHLIHLQKRDPSPPSREVKLCKPDQLK
jgi:hypothetical protein